MFDILKNLTKAATAVVTVPVGVAADALTLGGTLSNQDQPYTLTALEDFVQNLEAATRAN